MLVGTSCAICLGSLHVPKALGQLAAWLAPGVSCHAHMRLWRIPLSLRLVSPAKNTLPLQTVPDPPSFFLPNFIGAGIEGAHSCQMSLFLVIQEERYPSPKMETTLTLSIGQGPASASSLLWKVTPSWIPPSLELKIMEVWRQEARERKPQKA